MVLPGIAHATGHEDLFHRGSLAMCATVMYVLYLHIALDFECRSARAAAALTRRQLLHSAAALHLTAGLGTPARVSAAASMGGNAQEGGEEQPKDFRYTHM